MAQTPGELETEAIHFHQALLGVAPTPALVAAYVAAHEFYCATTVADAARIAAILNRNLDVEALELVLRRRTPALTRKLRVLVYLAEMDPANYDHFVNLKDRPIRGWLALVGGAVRTAGKFVQGRAILARNPDLLAG